MITLKINGQSRDFDVEADTPLLWVLRDEAQLTGTKFSCGIGACGACTVFLDGEVARSCVLPAGSVAGRDIRTIESLSTDRSHPVQQAWIAENVPQCGYCQSGMIMATVALLERTPEPSDAEIDAAISNLCRCGTYAQLRKAVHRAAALMKRARA